MVPSVTPGILAAARANSPGVRCGRLLPARRCGEAHRPAGPDERTVVSTAASARTSSSPMAPGSASVRCARSIIGALAPGGAGRGDRGARRRFRHGAGDSGRQRLRGDAGVARRTPTCAELAGDERLIAWLRQQLAAHARANPASSRCVRRARILPVAPSLDRGEITDKGSINQRAVLRNHARARGRALRGSASGTGCRHLTTCNRRRSTDAG